MVDLAIQTSEYMLPITYYKILHMLPNMLPKILQYICYPIARYYLQDYRVGVGQVGWRRYLTMHILVMNHYLKIFWCSEGSFPILKRMVPYYLHTQLLVVVAVVTLHNYIKQEGQKDWFFEKYSNDNMILTVVMRIKTTKHWLDLCRHILAMR